MALSGIINGTTSNPGIISRIEWSATQSIDGNYSVVTARGILNWTANLKTYGRGTYYLSIDGQQGSNTVYAEITYQSNTQVITVTKTVPHNADGSKTAQIKFWGGITETTLTSISCQATVTLDTIPRASTFTLPASANAGSDFTVTVKRASTAFTHDVKVTFGKQTRTYTGVTTSAACNIPLAWLTEIPNAASGQCTVEVITKSGSTVIGSKTGSITINVPTSVIPTVTVKALTPVSQKWSKYIQGKSKVKIELTAAGVYGSKITNYSITGGGFTGTSNPYTTGTLLKAGTYAFTCKVTDSRGRTATVNTANITVYEYAPPTFTTAAAVRCISNGTASSTGTYIAVTAAAAYSTCGGSNTLTLNAYYREKGAASWGSATALASGTKKVIGGGAVATNQYYEVLLRATDGYGSVDYVTAIGTAEFITVWGQDRAGIMMYPEGPGLWVGGPIYSQGDLVGSRIRTVTIPDGADLNDYRNSGFYASRSTQNTNIKNMPPTPTKAFELMVTGIADTGQYATQIVKPYSSNRCWIRTQSNYQTPWTWTAWAEISMDGHTHSYLPLSGGTVTGAITAPYIVTGGYAMSVNGTTYNSGASYCRTLKMAGSTNGNDQYFVQVDSNGRLRIGTQLNSATAPTWRNGIGPAIQLWSGSMTTGSITVNAAKTCTTIIIVGIPGSSSGWATTAVPTALIGSSALPLMISDDTYWFGLNVSASGNNVVIAARNGSGTIKYVFGV